jgi:hypothetical protein
MRGRFILFRITRSFSDHPSPSGYCGGLFLCIDASQFERSRSTGVEAVVSWMGRDAPGAGDQYSVGASRLASVSLTEPAS